MGVLIYQSLLWNCKKVTLWLTSVSNVGKSLCVLICKKVRLCVCSSEYLLQCFVPWVILFMCNIEAFLLRTEFFVITPTKKNKQKKVILKRSICLLWSSSSGLWTGSKSEEKSIRKQWLTLLCLCWRPRQDVMLCANKFYEEVTWLARLRGARLHLEWLHRSWHIVPSCWPLLDQHNLSMPIHGWVTNAAPCAGSVV